MVHFLCDFQKLEKHAHGEQGCRDWLDGGIGDVLDEGGQAELTAVGSEEVIEPEKEVRGLEARLDSLEQGLEEAVGQRLDRLLLKHFEKGGEGAADPVANRAGDGRDDIVESPSGCTPRGGEDTDCEDREGNCKRRDGPFI